jgi:hypothetical protein
MLSLLSISLAKGQKKAADFFRIDFSELNLEKSSFQVNRSTTSQLTFAKA